MRFSLSNLEHALAADDGALDLDIPDGPRLHRRRILVQDGKVGELAGLDGALDRLFERGVGRVDGEGAEALQWRQPLLGADDLTRARGAIHRAPDTEERLGTEHGIADGGDGR